MIHSVQVTIKPSVGQSCGLTRGHIDPVTLALTLHYQELVNVADTWQMQPKQQVLIEDTHFNLDAAAGVVMLLDHPFWSSLGLWRAADREESLLYKGQVKTPQYVEAVFEHYAPLWVRVTTDKAQIAGDGTDPLTIYVAREDGYGVTPIAVYGDDVKVGVIQVDSGGSRIITSNHAGTYRLQVDIDELDPTWNLPVFGPAEENGSVVVEVTSA